MMNQASMKRLEYDKIKEQLTDYTVSTAGRRLAELHEPSSNERTVRAWMNETDEAARLLDTGASIPLSAMEGIEPFIQLLGKGRIYNEQELTFLASWLASVAQMRRYMQSKHHAAPTISSYADSMHDCANLRDELERCLRYGQLTDQASVYLGDIRRQLAALEDRIERRLQQTMGKYKAALQEQIISKRGGHYVIPVKRELRKQVPGTVWDESASGQTLFVEPADIAELQSEWQLWQAEEEREKTVILSTLSELAETYGDQLRWNIEAMASFDFIFARAKLSRTWDGIAVPIAPTPMIKLVNAKHPLLGKNCLPLNVELGRSWRQLMITGPNTGGKTVTLKTMGLMAFMLQSGLLLPAEPGTELGLFDHIMADVGDGQSIEHSLSTFSAHMSNMKEMLNSAGTRSLLLLDELAAGTDPGEGIALSIAILEELLSRQSLVAATTHFNEIKRFAARTDGCANARMAFDPETLRPLYRLEIGEAGDSFAFAIAKRYGLPEHVIARAEARAALFKNTSVQQASSGTDAAEELQPYVPMHAGHSKSNAKQEATLKTGEQNEVEAGAGEGTSKRAFQAGDCVWIYPLKRTGIVYKAADERGEVVVQVQKQKLTFNRKRLSLYIAADQLYPGEDYDMDIVFETKADRKIRKMMKRKYVSGLTIEKSADDPTL
ncbi:dsDNA-specific endonuclease/ATPase MutS2 [Paenibacillus phyllosphaerae]|uniref:DsDNA-specific endonuclease/ATPase MutS2 n=1 Tax=Paenibacillus phyllosphaerae TaxID=274593 RepID=A0A7W5AWZ6_9BACL|nr:DNA mismatch repair protein MutS [Paenibacillus phyllosphaerae]MBB3110340.1 dsDNA-specific endonuclease/ATPase MutS2 [Paenibacillus phyllosphaerae]